MDYSGTMSRGWQIVWKNKWLVLLTLLPMLLSIAGSMLIFAANPAMLDTLGTPEEMMAGAGTLLLLYCVSLVITLTASILYLVGQGGQIAAVGRLARGEATGLRASFREGLRALPRLFVLGLILYGLPIVLFIVAIFALLVPVSFMAFAGETGQGDASALSGMLGILGVCCLYLFFFGAMLVVMSIFALGSRGIVLRKLGIVEAIRHGWRVLRENLGQVILLALPFVLIYIVMALIVYGLTAALAFRMMPAYPLTGGMGPGMLGGLLLIYLLYFVPMLVLYAWQSATLTLAYLKWTGKDVLGAGQTPPGGPPDVASWEPPAAPPLV